MTRKQLLTLAQTYADHAGISLSTLGVEVLANNQIFRKLAQGGDAMMSNAERAEEWFNVHWPAELPWPPSVPRPRFNPWS